MIECEICGFISGVPHDRAICPICKRLSPYRQIASPAPVLDDQGGGTAQERFAKEQARYQADRAKVDYR